MEKVWDGMLVGGYGQGLNKDAAEESISREISKWNPTRLAEDPACMWFPGEPKGALYELSCLDANGTNLF